MNQKKAAFFDKHAHEDWASKEYGPKETPKLKRLLNETKIENGQSILEPGCGTGRLTHVLAQTVGPKGSVIALDISSQMVKACSERNQKLCQVKVHQTSLENFAQKKPSFDRIVCHQVFPHFDDQILASQLLAKMLKPHGLLAIVHFEDSTVINDCHRKAGTVVEKDMIPSLPKMREILNSAGLEIQTHVEDELGYYLRAAKI